MGARIAGDEQWRFPETDTVPHKFEQCLIMFEDRWFYYHPGINPASLMRALYSNIKSGKIVSGGSTLTMQLARIVRKNRSRTIWQKMIEIVWATRMELRYSKRKLLSLYASHAPFGGNIVGLEAAAWRYFGRSPSQLSWAEAATLAVLPNAPSLIYPGKSTNALQKKRDRLLKQLMQHDIIDETIYQLSILEPVPDRIYPLPAIAPHLLDRIVTSQSGKRITTSLDYYLQIRASQLLNNHVKSLSNNGIHNATALIIRTSDKKVLAYIGNSSSRSKEHGHRVDVITAPRSTGSILKPFLYAAMLNEGLLLPTTLIPDVPTQIAGYMPKNFNRKYDGAVPAQDALARSLNVPAVHMLRSYGAPRLHALLKDIGMTTLNRHANHYGLSLILGGAEATLWDLGAMYTGMAQTLINYENHDGAYFDNTFAPLSYISNSTSNPHEIKSGPLKAAPCYLTLQALQNVERPDEEAGWEAFASTRNIAWKTGTSFGFRDAWAIGVTRDYVVAVWAGNADGEGRPGLTGARAAAPLLFELFELLPHSQPFNIPLDEMSTIGVCRHSGHRPGRFCEQIDTIHIPYSGLKSTPCPYHRLIHLDKTKNYRVTSACEQIADMHHVNWFVLPPIMEWYYTRQHPLYQKLPPWKPGCASYGEQIMQLLSPTGGPKFFMPVQLDGTPGELVFKIAHKLDNMIIHWHLDNNYLGTTHTYHENALRPTPGKHRLSLVDQDGNAMVYNFEIVQH